MWDKITVFLEKLSNSLKFKENDTFWRKFFKILLRVVGIAILIAVSPLLIVLVILIFMAAT